MKKIVASVGLVALGASSLHAQSASSLTSETAKPWSVSATLRGFYDDNINSLPDGVTPENGGKRDSFGFEVSPSVVVSLPLEQTTIGLSYLYSAKYYENRLALQADKWDMTHTFNASVDHAFNQRFQASVRDSFVIGQEPDLLRAGNAFETYQRIPGDNIRNYGAINFDAQLTRLLGMELGYGNAYYDYSGDTAVINDGLTLISPAAALNRIEHTIHLDSRWQLQPDTVGVFGYQFREIDYTADQLIGTDFNGDEVFSDARNAHIHYGYLGVDHTFRPDLSGALRAGASYADYYNSPGKDSTVAPYVLASLRWTYLPQSYLELGFTHDLNSTDQTGFFGNTGSLTVDSESSVVYARISHRITPKLFGNVTAQYQYSEFNGGALNGQDEQFVLAGVSLEYRINHFLSAEVGYNYDNLDSNKVLNRGFDRNRVYIGVTASY